MAAYKTITREQLKAKLDKGEKFHFWCVLTQEWYKNLLIAGSQWVPLDKMEMHIKEAVVKPTDEIVVYCGSQQCSQSRQAAERLVEKGFANVYAYEGGIADWQEADLPMSRA